MNKGCKFNGKECLNCGKIHPDRTGKKERIKKICKLCGNGFEVLPCRDAAKYCSMDCYKKIASDHLKVYNFRKGATRHLEQYKFKKGRIPHNKGKTKNNYEPLKIVGEKTSVALQEYYQKNPHDDKYKKNMSISCQGINKGQRSKYAKEQMRGVKHHMSDSWIEKRKKMVKRTS